MFSNFLHAYEVYSSGNEAPEIYHRWTALSCLACFVSRRVWVPQGFLTVYPNLYIVFVGKPGNGKSTAMGIGRKLVRSLDKFCPIVPPSITREALTQDMGDKESKYYKQFSYQGKSVDYVPALIFANEMVTFLGQANPMGMIEFLTDIWDEDMFEVKTKNKGCDVIPHPFVNLLGCMTPETTGNLLKEQIISGGFERRAVFVHATRSTLSFPRPIITPEQVLARDWLVKWASQLCMLVGQMNWTKGAEEVFDHWYVKNKDYYTHHVNGWMEGYYTSKDVLVIKLAMLYSLSESVNMTLEPRHINQALNILSEAELGMKKVFAGTGSNEQASLAERIYTAVSSAKTVINLKAVLIDFFDHGSYDDICKAVDHLVMADRIRKHDYSPSPGVTVTVLGTPPKLQCFLGLGDSSRIQQLVQQEQSAPGSAPTDRPSMPVVDLRGHRPVADPSET